MENTLQVYAAMALTAEEQQQISLELDNLINAQKNNRQSINKLVFECVTAMTVADDISKELADKKGISRFVGAITGSNKALQDKINTNRSVAQYASQVCLQKLAEQNLMSFDLITAVNNKLNASLIRTDEEFNKVYDTLTKFFKKNRSELVRIESRLEKVERNVNLLNWQNSIEYQEFNGVEYADLDAISKIVCLTRDFYDITQGNWSTSDLLLLKTAMSTIDIDPKAEVNYYEAIKMIAEDEPLKNKLLGGLKLHPVKNIDYLLSFSGLQKLIALNGEDSYVIDTVAEYAKQNNIDIDRAQIEDIVASKYLANLAQVNINVEIECFDLLLDLLYNLQNYEADYTDIAEYEVQNVRKSIEFVVEGSLVDNLDKIKKYAEKGNARALYLLAKYYSEYISNQTEAEKCLHKAADLGKILAVFSISKDNTSEDNANEIINKIVELAENGDSYACYELGEAYEFGKFVEKNHAQAISYYEKAVSMGNEIAEYALGYIYYEGNGVEKDYLKAIEYFEKANNIACASCFLGWIYEFGEGVNSDLPTAMSYYLKAIDNGVSLTNYFNDPTYRSVSIMIQNKYSSDKIRNFVKNYYSEEKINQLINSFKNKIDELNFLKICTPSFFDFPRTYWECSGKRDALSKLRDETEREFNKYINALKKDIERNKKNMNSDIENLLDEMEIIEKIIEINKPDSNFLPKMILSTEINSLLDADIQIIVNEIESIDIEDILDGFSADEPMNNGTFFHPSYNYAFFYNDKIGGSTICKDVNKKLKNVVIEIKERLKAVLAF